MEPLIYIFAAVAVLAIISRLIPSSRKTTEHETKKFEYARKQYIMTKAEKQFFDMLQQVYGAQYYVFPQVHLSTILDHQVKGQNWKAALSAIQRKSVDFVICNKAYLNPLVAIELDDSTHERPDRVERDSKVEAIFEQVGLPLVRFKSSVVDEGLLRQRLDRHLR